MQNKIFLFLSLFLFLFLFLFRSWGREGDPVERRSKSMIGWRKRSPVNLSDDVRQRRASVATSYGTGVRQPASDVRQPASDVRQPASDVRRTSGYRAETGVNRGVNRERKIFENDIQEESGFHEEDMSVCEKTYTNAGEKSHTNRGYEDDEDYVIIDESNEALANVFLVHDMHEENYTDTGSKSHDNRVHENDNKDDIFIESDESVVNVFLVKEDQINAEFMSGNLSNEADSKDACTNQIIATSPDCNNEVSIEAKNITIHQEKEPPRKKSILKNLLLRSKNKIGTFSPKKIKSSPKTHKQTFAQVALTAKAAGKFMRHRKACRQFNYEKFIKFLELTLEDNGFSISKVTITWKRVTTFLVILFTMVGAFAQNVFLD